MARTKWSTIIKPRFKFGFRPKYQNRNHGKICRKHCSAIKEKTAEACCFSRKPTTLINAPVQRTLGSLGDTAMPFPQPFFRWRPHPWHGLEVGPEPPEMVTAYIEITPFDSVKYEVDKKTGYLMVDRPNRTSSQPPALYGFIPRTYCGPRVQALAPQSKCGDRDPLDICVLSERPIQKNEIS